MQIILEANGLWEMVELNEKTQADNKKDKTAIAFLYQALPEEQLLQITKHKTAKAIWGALKTRHIGEERVQQARLQTLKSDFEILHIKEDETIDTFTRKLTTLVNKEASLGHTIEDQTLVRKLLNTVPERYLQIVASIEQYSDLSEMTLEEAIGRLKTYEEKIKYKRGKQVDNQEKLMFTRHDNKRKETCKKVEEQKVSLHEEDVGYKETNMDSLWYLNNGASNHMTVVREHFKELDEKVSGKVRFGDGSYIEIKGKGTILIECDDEKQRIISQVYYIPDLKSNLLSLGQFTEIGCKVVMEDDKLRLYDMDNKILMKVTRQRNRLYKANLRIESLEDITPYEAIKRRKPNLENLRVVGCIAYAKVPSQHLKKLDDRSSRMVYLGNEQGSKSYRLFDPTTQKICVSRDVKFKENETWDWKEYMSEHINDEPKWTDFKIGNLEVTNEHHDQGIQPIEEDNEFPNNNDDDYASPTRDSTSHSQTPHIPSIRSSQVNSQVTPNISTQSNYQSDNDSIQTTNSPSHFDHMSLRGFRTLNDLYENTEELLLAEDEPMNYKEASSDQKWIEAIKVELDSINRNNTLELTTLPKGHKAIGFIKRHDNGKVYRLIKALYGLRQAPRAWNIELDNTLKSLDFKKCTLEQAIYTKTSKDSTLLIGVYVDDLIITGTPNKEIDKFKAQMEEKFEMSDLELLAYYLGIEVTQTDGDISIKQSAYANKILKEAGINSSNNTRIMVKETAKQAYTF
nr:ribonuclease H-like domain, reverse transcriptase, RNA-dependent DNA polymerase [Tanacetum cinerariifolium]